MKFLIFFHQKIQKLILCWIRTGVLKIIFSKMEYICQKLILDLKRENATHQKIFKIFEFLCESLKLKNKQLFCRVCIVLLNE